MSKEITFILEECLSQIAAGEATVQNCVDRYPAWVDQLEPLLLAAKEIRVAPKPVLAPEARARIEARLLDAIEVPYKEKDMQASSSHKTQDTAAFSLRHWLRLPVVLAALVTLLFIGVLVAVVGRGGVNRSSRDAQVVQGPPYDPIPEMIPKSTIASHALESGHTVFVPVVVAPGHPQRASLKGVRGLVQVQTDDGTWATVGAKRTIAAGQRIRTGELSSARLIFHDGSQAHLGPDTEISVDELDARRSGGPRIVALTQWTGQTDHDVAPAQYSSSRYEVRTPSGTAKAQGTSFQVLVTADLLTRFSVDEGAVAVTNLNVTVVVLAGQLTTVNPNQKPSEPVFRITGEGEVTQTGITWIIGGQTFETHDHTVIVGNPQVGDWVYVEGHLLPDDTRVVDLILLLRRAPVNHFNITGRVQAIEDTTWTIAGQAITVNDATTVKDDIEVGDHVSVEGVILGEGTFLAEQIHLIEDAPGLPFDFAGVVQEITDEAWTISGVTIAVTTTTEIDAGLAVGDVVHAFGWILEDDKWLASAIERYEEDESGFEFTGEVESTDPWVVAGIPFETDEWTAIESDIKFGDRVRVRGRILQDGTWLATEIERLEDDEIRYVVFTGMVTSLDPWVVNGIPLVVNDETAIDGDIAIGDLVEVKARVLLHGIWLAKEIRRVDTDFGLGCFSITAVVLRVGPGQIELLNWPAIDLDGVSIEGQIRVGSIVRVLVCVGRDGTLDIVSIIVIYQPEPVIVPPPAPQPPSPPSDGNDKITICHRPPGNPNAAHTITISRAALQEHLSHGDTIGPCK